MPEHTPESGYPRINLSDGEAFSPYDVFVLADGQSLSGAQLNDAMQRYFSESPRGQQLQKHLQGDGPAPEPLYSLLTDGAGDERVLLGRGEVDVTDAEPLAETMLKELLHRDD